MSEKRISTKKAVAVLAIAFLVFGGIAAGVMFWQVLPGSPGANREPYAERFELELADGDDVSLSLDGVDVKVTPYDGDTLVALFEGTVAAGRAEQNRIVARRTGNCAEIIQNPDSRPVISLSFGFGGTELRGTLSVQVPGKQISRVRTETSSGSIVISDITAGELAVSTASGNISLDGCVLDSLEADTFSGNARLDGGEVSGVASVSTSSGNIDVAGFDAGSLSAGSFSGNIEFADSVIAGDLLANASSGNVVADGLAAGSVAAETFSGNVEMLRLSAQNAGVSTSSGNVLLELVSSADIICDTFSGDVSIALPAAMGFKLSFDTFSGSLSSELASMSVSGGMGDVDLSVGDGARAVDVSTSSGNLKLSGSRSE